MAKTPGHPSGSGAGSADPIDPTKVSIFDPKGMELDAFDEETPGSPAPSKAPAVAASEPPPPVDDNPAVARRVASRAGATAKQYADDLGDALYEKFMHILTAKVAESGGSLDMDDVAAMGDEFRKELKSIEKTFLDAVEAFTLAREKSRAEMSRSDMFHRVLVHKFEHVFADEKTAAAKPERLSRRMLPGFFTVLNLMFGKQRLAAYERKVADAVEQSRRKNGGAINWVEVYRSPKVRNICLKAEIEIAQHFVEGEKRLHWMIAVLNSSLIPPDASYAGRAWEPNELAVVNLLSALFSDLGKALGNDKTRGSMEEQLGAGTVAQLETTLRRFRAAR